MLAPLLAALKESGASEEGERRRSFWQEFPWWESDLPALPGGSVARVCERVKPLSNEEVERAAPGAAWCAFWPAPVAEKSMSGWFVWKEFLQFEHGKRLTFSDSRDDLVRFRDFETERA